MGGEFIEIRITHPWEFIQPAPEVVRPRLLDWQVDAKGRHVAWRYRISRYDGCKGAACAVGAATTAKLLVLSLRWVC